MSQYHDTHHHHHHDNSESLFNVVFWGLVLCLVLAVITYLIG